MVAAKKLKLMINHSNHPKEKWDEKQKEGWDIIHDIPFPNIAANASVEDVKKLVDENITKILQIIKDYEAEVYIMAQGEFTYSYLFYKNISKAIPNGHLAFPCSERIVRENDKGEKISVFQFAGWRILPLNDDNNDNDKKRQQKIGPSLNM